MFDVGFAELFMLSLIGLLVLGPERLPAVARTIGGFVRKARISYHNLKRTVEAELAAADAANPLKEAQKELESVQRQVNELKGQLDQNIAPNLEPERENHDPQRPQGERDAPGEESGDKPDETPDTEPEKALAHDGQASNVKPGEAVGAELAEDRRRTGESSP
jgi:sec-independent protein translocase protein TatB